MLFAAADAIEEAGMRLREQQDLTGSPLAALLPRLDAAASGIAARKEASSTVAAPPAASLSAQAAELPNGKAAEEPSLPPAVAACDEEPETETVALPSAAALSAAAPVQRVNRCMTRPRCASPPRSWTPSSPATANCWWRGGACRRASRT